MGQSAKLHGLADEESLETTQRYMTWRYSIALLVIAVLVLLSYLAMQMVIGAYEQNSSLINVSGKQRMLLQRIALFSTQLVHADSSTEREFLASQLERSANEMEVAHKGLTQGSEELGISSVLSEELEAMYWEDPLAVDDMVKTYLEQTRLLIAQAAGAGPASVNCELHSFSSQSSQSTVDS